MGRAPGRRADRLTRVNLITQVLATDPDTEVMATGLLLVATAAVLWRERQLFFGGPVRPRACRVASGRL